MPDVAVRRVHDALEAQRVPHALAHHQRRVVEQVVRCDDVHLADVDPQPPGDPLCGHALVRGYQPPAHQIFRLHVALGHQRVVRTDHESPAHAARDLDEVVPALVGRLYEHTEVRQPPVQAVGDVLSVAAVDLERNVRVPLDEGAHRAGDGPHGLHLACADAYRPADVLRRADLVGRHLGELQDLGGAAPQQRPLLGELHVPVPADHEDDAELPLQRRYLPGEVRLAHVQPLRRRGYAALLRGRQEVPQRLQIHGVTTYNKKA